MSCMRVMARKVIPQTVRRTDDRVLDHLQSDAPCRDGGLAASREDAQGLDHSVAASGRNGPLTGEGGMRRVLRIEIVVLAAPAPILIVRRRDLQDLNPRLLSEAEQASAIAAGRFDADAPELAERSHPAEHLPVALAGGGEASRSENAVMFIDDRRDMQILVGIHAADDASACPSSSIHC